VRTVLVIDDDPVILEVLAEYLGSVGLRAVTARGGSQGLDAFTRERPDAVICDLGMPGLGGLEVLSRVRSAAPLVPFVVLSGTADVRSAVEALQKGAWDYLLKPLADLELLPPLLARLEERAVFLAEKEQYQSRLEVQVAERTAELTRQLAEKDVLLAEVHHRVKNNLQIIQVILGLQHDHSADPQVRQALEAGRHRIHALAMVQEEMYDSDTATLVNARSYGAGIVHHLLSAYGLTTGADLDLDLDDAGLEPGLAFTLGLVVNELMSGLAEGTRTAGRWTLRVRLEVPTAKALALTLEDSREGWVDWAPAADRPSLGWDLVDALARQHGGTLDWSPDHPGRITVRLN